MQNNNAGLHEIALQELQRLRNVSRRHFLKIGAGGVSALVGTSALSHQAIARDVPRLKRQSKRFITRTQGTTFDPVLLKLIDRTSFGFTRAQYSIADSMGYDAYLEYQLDYESIDDSELEARISAAAGYDTLTKSTYEIYTDYQTTPNVPVFQLAEATILRAIYSKRQLFERMVQFWSDHFSIDINDGSCRIFKTADDRNVIRQHALTTFPQLLNASARSGAMLFYLDNYTNVAGHAQENYARELMELHTMGVDGGYTQQDVQEVARCLTGWTFDPRTGNPNYGEFIFYGGRHDNGTKTVLGTTLPPEGWQNDGQAVLDILAYHPSTARFIARKLCTRFLGYDPPEDVVEMVKDTYLATGGDIKSMLRVILHPTMLTYLSTPKFKRPLHLIASQLRATQANVVRPFSFLINSYVMGHAPFYWGPPNGYPDALDEWANALLPRWQYASNVMYGFYQNPSAVTFDLAGLLESEGGNAPGQQAAAIDRILTGGRFTDEELTQLQNFFDRSGYGGILQDAMGLAASLPGFQWY